MFVRGSDCAFFGIAALLFAVSSALTIIRCTSMAAMGGMRMAGGWTMSMMWMRVPGETWLGALAPFLGMWVVMMAAMMLPSFMAMLSGYRSSVRRTTNVSLGRATLLVGVGYFFVWSVIGIAVYLLAAAMAALEMRSPTLARVVPSAAGAIVLIAGVLQFTAWKAHHLACCRDLPARVRPLRPHAGAAWRLGVRLGLHCSYSCASLMAILLVIGIMDLRTMVVVTAAITVERLAPRDRHVERAIGAIIITAGMLWLARVAGLA